MWRFHNALYVVLMRCDAENMVWGDHKDIVAVALQGKNVSAMGGNANAFAVLVLEIIAKDSFSVAEP
jgi:hypothetical protein